MTDFEKWINLMKHGIKTNESEKLEESYKRCVEALKVAKQKQKEALKVAKQKKKGN